MFILIFKFGFPGNKRKSVRFDENFLNCPEYKKLSAGDMNNPLSPSINNISNNNVILNNHASVINHTDHSKTSHNGILVIFHFKKNSIFHLIFFCIFEISETLLNCRKIHYYKFIICINFFI